MVGMESRHREAIVAEGRIHTVERLLLTFLRRNGDVYEDKKREAVVTGAYIRLALVLSSQARMR